MLDLRADLVHLLEHVERREHVGKRRGVGGRPELRVAVQVRAVFHHARADRAVQQPRGDVRALGPEEVVGGLGLRLQVDARLLRRGPGGAQTARGVEWLGRRVQAGGG